MKNKLFSIFTALAMVLGILVSPFTSAHAAEATETESVTIHKILLTKDALEKHDKNKKYDGNEIGNIQDFFGDTTAKDIGGVYFRLEKLNDGVAEDQVDVKDDTQWTAIPDKVEGETTIKYNGLTVEDAGLTLNTKGLKGTYRIVEDLTKSTYKGENGALLAASKAVPTKLVLPMVNEEQGIVQHGHVYPKNTQEKPKLDKNFSVEEAKKHITEQEALDLDAAIEHKVAFDKAKKAYAETTDEYKNAEKAYTAKDKELIAKWGIDFDNNQREKQEITKKIGDDVGYVVETEIPKDAKYKKLVWNDNMTKGLTYNKDLTIEGAGLTAEDYTIVETDKGFTLVLKESGLTKVEEAAKTADVTIKLTYSARVNETSVVDKPDLNDIALDYSNIPGKDNEPKEFTPGKDQITMKKTWDITGDQTITDADKNVVAYFTLQKKNEEGKWEDVKTVEKTSKEEFTVTFDNLDPNGTYRIVESVKGYEAEYMEYNEETGEIEIKDHKNTDNPDNINPSEPKVVTGGKRFVKTNADGTERLLGAGFKIENQNEGADKGKFLKVNNDDDKASQAYAAAQKAYEDAINAVNKALEKGEISEDNKAKIGDEEFTTKAAAEQKIADLETARNTAYEKAQFNYEWVVEDEATVFYTNEKGQFEVKGLAYGNYRAKETQKPAGYALPTDGGNFTFEVKKGSYTSEDKKPIEYKPTDTTKEAKQIVNNKVTIPQTGGIGSLIFVVAGLAIMAGAYAAYRKSQARA